MYDLLDICYPLYKCNIVQRSGLGPTSFAITASDLKTIGANNLLYKFADDTYIGSSIRSDIPAEMNSIYMGGCNRNEQMARLQESCRSSSVEKQWSSREVFGHYKMPVAFQRDHQRQHASMHALSAKRNPKCLHRQTCLYQKQQTRIQWQSCLSMIWMQRVPVHSNWQPLLVSLSFQEGTLALKCLTHSVTNLFH